MMLLFLLLFSFGGFVLADIFGMERCDGFGGRESSLFWIGAKPILPPLACFFFPKFFARSSVEYRILLYLRYNNTAERSGSRMNDEAKNNIFLFFCLRWQHAICKWWICCQLLPSWFFPSLYLSTKNKNLMESKNDEHTYWADLAHVIFLSLASEMMIFLEDRQTTSEAPAQDSLWGNDSSLFLHELANLLDIGNEK